MQTHIDTESPGPRLRGDDELVVLLFQIFMKTDKRSKLHCCRVCGLHYNNYYPWGKDGRTPLFDICRCCRVEFGNEDFTPESAAAYRAEWLKGGGNWFEVKSKPTNWSLVKQLENIMSPEAVEHLLQNRQ